MTEKSNEKYQIRVTLSEQFARVARENPYAHILEPVADILRPHQASLRCQLHLLESFLSACDAHGASDITLAKWTRDVVANPLKREKYGQIFVVAVKGQELFSAETAMRVNAGLERLKAQGIVTDIKCINNDPAQNPQAPRRYR